MHKEDSQNKKKPKNQPNKKTTKKVCIQMYPVRVSFPSIIHVILSGTPCKMAAWGINLMQNTFHNLASIS